VSVDLNKSLENHIDRFYGMDSDDSDESEFS